MNRIVLVLAVLVCLFAAAASVSAQTVVYQTIPVYVSPPTYYYTQPIPPVYVQPQPTYYYYPAPTYYYPPPIYYRQPNVYVKPMVYVEGQPIRNFFQAITP